VSLRQIETAIAQPQEPHSSLIKAPSAALPLLSISAYPTGYILPPKLSSKPFVTSKARQNINNKLKLILNLFMAKLLLSVIVSIHFYATENTMLTYQATHTETHRTRPPEPVIIDNTHNNYTITRQDDIRKKLNHLFNKNALLSIKVPGKLVTSTLLTTITCIEGDYIFLGGFQNERSNKDLLMQNTVAVSANFEGISISFVLSELSGHDINAAFNLKASLPQNIEWVQRRDARRVKVPINIPVTVQYKNQSEHFNVTDISVAGLSYIYPSENQHPANLGRLYTDCNIILPDKSIFLASLEITNNTTIPYRHTKQINRIGCEIKRASYQLDTALQRLINKIDFYYQ